MQRLTGIRGVIEKFKREDPEGWKAIAPHITLDTGDDCPTCEGEGTVSTAAQPWPHTCLDCNGTGQQP
jgi:DnaJ-class molecular chaperone